MARTKQKVKGRSKAHQKQVMKLRKRKNRIKGRKLRGKRKAKKK
jgi:hypothetical protein